MGEPMAKPFTRTSYAPGQPGERRFQVAVASFRRAGSDDLLSLTGCALREDLDPDRGRRIGFDVDDDGECLQLVTSTQWLPHVRERRSAARNTPATPTW